MHIQCYPLVICLLPVVKCFFLSPVSYLLSHALLPKPQFHLSLQDITLQFISALPRFLTAPLHAPASKITSFQMLQSNFKISVPTSTDRCDRNVIFAIVGILCLLPNRRSSVTSQAWSKSQKSCDPAIFFTPQKNCDRFCDLA